MTKPVMAPFPKTVTAGSKEYGLDHPNVSRDLTCNTRRLHQKFPFIDYVVFKQGLVDGANPV